MSVPTQTTLQHACADPRGFGHGIVYEMPSFGMTITPALLLRNLGLSGQEDELRRVLNEQARKLPLPSAAVITDRVEAGDARCEELLDVLTVLAKSSGRVYLRDKEPNLGGLVAGRRVVVLVPQE
jgi:hypothetical protein